MTNQLTNMKNIITIATIFLFATNINGQSLKASALNPNVYRTKVDLTVTRIIDKDFKTVYEDEYIIKVDELGHIDYKIVKEDDNGYVIIRILPKTTMSTEISKKDKTKTVKVIRHTKDKLLKSDKNNAYNYYFAIKKDKFKPMAKTLLSEKIVGIPLVQPLKLRPSKGSEGWNLGGEFTVNYNFGLRLKLDKNPFSQNFISLVPYGFGVGSAKYFSENSDGTLTDKKDSYAITYYQAGIVLTLQKVNLGIFTGFDAMIDKQNNWFYQGEQWFSIGLGYKFKTE